MNARVFKHEKNTLRVTPPFLYLNAATTVQVWAYWYLQEGKSQQWARERKKKTVCLSIGFMTKVNFSKDNRGKQKVQLSGCVFPVVQRCVGRSRGWAGAKGRVSQSLYQLVWCVCSVEMKRDDSSLLPSATHGKCKTHSTQAHMYRMLTHNHRCNRTDKPVFGF